MLLLTSDNTDTFILLLYSLIGIGALYMLYVITVSMTRNYKRLRTQKELVKDALQRNMPVSEEFLALRKKMLLKKADEAGVDARWKSVVKVYGVAVDWRENNLAHFFVALQNGKTMKLIQNNVINETNDQQMQFREMVGAAAELKKQTQFTIDISLPSQDELKFWLLTTDGLHTLKMSNSIAETNAWQSILKMAKEMKNVNTIREKIRQD